MKEFYISCQIGNVSFRNKVTCDQIKIESESIVCYIDEKVVGVFPCASTLVTSEELKPESLI